MEDQKKQSSYEGVASHIESMANEKAPPKTSLDDLKDETRIYPNNPQVNPFNYLKKAISIRRWPDQLRRTGPLWPNTPPT